jgi:hypothetical protein
VQFGPLQGGKPLSHIRPTWSLMQCTYPSLPSIGFLYFKTAVFSPQIEMAAYPSCSSPTPTSQNSQKGGCYKFSVCPSISLPAYHQKSQFNPAPLTQTLPSFLLPQLHLADLSSFFLPLVWSNITKSPLYPPPNSYQLTFRLYTQLPFSI